MNRASKFFTPLCFVLSTIAASGQFSATAYREMYRPQIHFSPREKWTNDPNGMVYYNGVYHLFFQYHPGSTVWGPMHWGHATSTDLVHWKEQPIALYPDSLGYIFSGSAVVDQRNTTGLGSNGKPPLVAIYTSHNAKKEIPERENQSIAYSTDAGNTWLKYEGNPVLKNPGISDFRDPKVMWYEPQQKWIMTLATKDRITFFSSTDLKSWNRESEFGKDVGAHGGVWECPDLFSLKDNGKTVWVLIVNLNPGGPNKGSATQYFLGSFDGHQFTPFDTKTKWIDYGPDEYAGITWSNTGNRKIFLGWMSNWLYANKVPTENWRNAMTVPRELFIKHAGSEMLIASRPVKELATIELKPIIIDNLQVGKNFDLSDRIKNISFPCRLNLQADATKDFAIVLTNDLGEEMLIGYDNIRNQYYFDRKRSGRTDFQTDFAASQIAPRFIGSPHLNLTLLIDWSSVELFADDGLTVMTGIFFPHKPYDRIQLRSAAGNTFKKIEMINYKSIWE